jgi:23S rRNA A2030 N6-methylase RlmJ
MLGSSMFVINPPHTLAAVLKPVLPWLAGVLDQTGGSGSSGLESG